MVYKNQWNLQDQCRLITNKWKVNLSMILRSLWERMMRRTTILGRLVMEKWRSDVPANVETFKFRCRFVINLRRISYRLKEFWNCLQFFQSLQRSMQMNLRNKRSEFWSMSHSSITTIAMNNDFNWYLFTISILLILLTIYWVFSLFYFKKEKCFKLFYSMIIKWFFNNLS